MPGFWLGAWAWDEVVGELTTDGITVHPITLPGLEQHHDDRSSITLEDHVTAITSAVDMAGDQVVLAVHSGAGVPGFRGGG